MIIAQICQDGERLIRLNWSQGRVISAGYFTMTRQTEVALALILIPVSGLCLWALSYWTGAITATIALAISTVLYMHSERAGP